STALGFGRELAARIDAEGLLASDRRRALRAFLDQRRVEYQLDMVEVFAGGQALARTRRGDLTGKVGIEPWNDLVRRAAGGQEGSAVHAVGEADMVRAAVPIVAGGRTAGVVVVDAYVPKSVVKQREEIDRAFGEYLRLKIQRRPIQTAYTITLALVSLVVLFSATWVGFYVAREITAPIQRLAEGTRAVARGDLEHRIPGEGDDEIGTLVTAFNRMTADLATNRAELEARRRYLETLLANITAGVLSADAEGRITTMNHAAEQLLGVSAAACVGRAVDEAFVGDAYGELRQLAAELRAERVAEPTYAVTVGGPVCLIDGADAAVRRRVERQLKLERDGGETAVLLTGTRLLDDAGGQRGEGGAVFDECTRTIIQQVEELKALVNEFSTFARMPAGEHSPQDLNALVEEALVLFREGHRDLDFTFAPDPSLPILELDREGVKRAVINILDNAVAACAAVRQQAPSGTRPAVTLTTTYDAT